LSKQFLSRYFQAVHDKLDADALLYNKEISHAGLKGALNEMAIADVIRDFLPRRFGVETNALIIDRHGNTSKECDIVIYDDERFPKYFRKVFPIELVHAVIEVKTTLTAQEAAKATEALLSVNMLDFRPALTPYWMTRTVEQKLLHHPPLCGVFAYRSDARAFETFAKWFAWDLVNSGTTLEHSEIRNYLIGALDQGMINMASGDGYVFRWAAISGEGSEANAIDKRMLDQDVRIDPAKSLFYFLERLWVRLSSHSLHPGFDIRTYMDEELGVVVELPSL